MTHRRTLLVAGFALLVAEFLNPPVARATVELQGTGFGGTESAYYGSCNGGAGVRAKYGGVGFAARLYPFFEPAAANRRGSLSQDPRATAPAATASSEPQSGFAMTSILAGNWVSARLKYCEGDCAGFDPGRFPVEQLQLGANFRLGADWRWFGFEVGGLAWQRLRAPGKLDALSGEDEDAPALLPDVQLRIGPLDAFYVDLGFGAYNAPTVLRPGLYAGLGTCQVAPLQAEVHYGVHMPLGSDDGAARLDVALYHQLGAGAKVGIGVAWTDDGARFQGEGYEGRLSYAQRY